MEFHVDSIYYCHTHIRIEIIYIPLRNQFFYRGLILNRSIIINIRFSINICIIIMISRYRLFFV